MQYGQRKLQRSVTEMRRSCSRRPNRSRTGSRTGLREGWSGVTGGVSMLTRGYSIVASDQQACPARTASFAQRAGGERRPAGGRSRAEIIRVQLLASEEYGLRCLIQVSRSAGGTPVSISQIADAEGLSPEYTAKLMRELRLGGLVDSVRGAEGGYRLARPAEAISVWSALEVLGG